MKKTVNQTGFVSIIMALIIMVFVTLIALGFAFLARQNAEQNENRQLSTQAFYAAESGVNDAINFMTSKLKLGQPIPSATSCDDTKLANANFTPTIGSTNSEVKYTCVLFNPNPTSLEYTVDPSSSEIIKIQSANGQTIKTITVSWQASGGSSLFATNNHHWLPQANSGATGGDDLAANTGILRATLTPIMPTITRTELLDRSQTTFLYPKVGSGGSGSYQAYFNGKANSGTYTQGSFADGNCRTDRVPKYCSVTFMDLGSVQSENTGTYYLRLKAMYSKSNVTISATDALSSPSSLTGTQAVIDSTGKASNVLRRIQVRVPLGTGSYAHPEAAIETMTSLCKRLYLWPGNSAFDNPTGRSKDNDACDPDAN